MTYRVTGLDPAPFAPLFDLSDEALAARRARRVVADAKPGFPDRVGLRDAEIGETLILVHHTDQDADTPYHASHAIFVAQGSGETYDAEDELPAPLLSRDLSLRAFDANGDMVDADLAKGADVEPAILRLLGSPDVAYIHAHFARRGCYAARIART